MIASKVLGLVAFLAGPLTVLTGAKPLVRRTPKSTGDAPQSITMPSTGRNVLMRRKLKFTHDTPQNMAVDSVGRMAEESVGAVPMHSERNSAGNSQESINALLQVNAQGDVINTDAEESLSAKKSAVVVKKNFIDSDASRAENSKNTYRFVEINGEAAVTSMEDLSAPRLCDEGIVSDMCMALNNQTKEYYKTETDADMSIVHAAELAEQLSSSKGSVLSFLNKIGAANLETDKLLLDHGAFAVKCMDLCLKVVESIPKHLRPPTSDVACIPSADPVAAPDCNIDVSPKTLDAFTEAKFHDEHVGTNGDNEGGLKETNKTTPFEATEKEKDEMNEILDQQNEDKPFEQLQVDVALLFRIHPVANMSIEMDDGNKSDEPHWPDAKNASGLHVLEHSSLAGLESARRSHMTKHLYNIHHLNQLARAWMSSVVSKMAGGRVNHIVAKWFKSSDRYTVNDVRRSMDSAVGVLGNVLYKGVDCRAGVAAYVYQRGLWSKEYWFWGRYIVQLCSLFWDRRFSDLAKWQYFKVHVLIHEAMHHASAYEKDVKYDCRPSLMLPRQQGLNNADSMAYFATEVHGRVPC